MKSSFCRSLITSVLENEDECKSYLSVSLVPITISYNQPTFCPSATWNPNATTLSNDSTVSLMPFGIFVDFRDTVYVGTQNTSGIQVWAHGSDTPTTINTTGSLPQYALFVASNGDIYINSAVNMSSVEIWRSNSSYKTGSTYLNATCFGMFVDLNNTFYCSIAASNQVITYSQTVMIQVVAGDGSTGNDSITLNNPHGIFVDTNFTLYVADSNNSRIQRFRYKDNNGTTVIGGQIPSSIVLNYPTGVVVDGKGYLFIVDSGNNRIIGRRTQRFSMRGWLLEWVWFDRVSIELAHIHEFR